MKPRTVQQPRVAGLVDTRFDVLMGAVKVGEVVKNKHNMWWGHFSPHPEHSVLNPSFVDGVRSLNPPLEFCVHPSRRKVDVVAAVVAAEYGRYANALRVAAANRAFAAALDDPSGAFARDFPDLVVKP